MGRKHIVVATMLLLLTGLFARPGLLELRGEEPRRAVVSAEMVETGNWLIPKIHGAPYYNKPPLFNWAVATTYKLTGNYSETSARLPSLIAYILTALLLFVFTRSLLGWEPALLAALFYLISADLLFYGSIYSGEIDLFYSFIVFIQVLITFHFGSQNNNRSLFLYTWLLTAIGFLTKGMPSIAFQVFTLASWMLYSGRWKRLFSIWNLAGVLLFLGVTGGYFALYARSEWAWGFLVNLFKEASQRTGIESSPSDLSKDSLMFPIRLILITLPGSLLIVFAVGRKRFKKLWDVEVIRFCIIWLLLNMPVYWLSGEVANRYLYMFFPFISLVSVYAWYKFNSELPLLRKIFDYLPVFMLLILIAGGIALPLIKVFRDAEFIILNSVFMVSVSLIMMHYWWRQKKFRIYLYPAIAAVVKVSLLFTYLPLVASNTEVNPYKQHMINMIDIAGDRPIAYTGDPYVFKRDASLGPFNMFEVTLSTPPLLAYQIPYYQLLEKGEIMQYIEDPIPGNLYVVRQSYTPENIHILYRYFDKTRNEDMLLVEIL